MEILFEIIKNTGILLVFLFVIYILVSLVVYRFTSEEEVTVVGNVHYKLIELDYSNRIFFETIFLRNRMIRLEDNSTWYVSKEQRNLLWPESPHAMLEQGYTIKVKIKAKKLYFGGYGKAEVIRHEKINEEPLISK